jgi:integrase
VAVPRGVSFEHKKGTECSDAKFHRHCQGRWRGSVSMGFDAAGKRMRRRVTGPTKTAVLEIMAQLREELGHAPRSSRTYTVNEAVTEWLDGGLPGRSERTRNAYKEALAPLLAMIGHRPLRELTAVEVRKALASLSSRYSTRYLQIARNSLERANRFAQVHERVGRNVVQLIEAPTGRIGRPSKSLTLVEARAMLKAAEGERLFAYIVVSLLSGIRTEEIRALRWEHVHFKDRPETVPHIDVWRADRVGSDTKTPRSRRSLRLPELCVEALLRQKEQQNIDRRIAGAKWQENGLVFASTVGTPLLAGNVRRAFRGITRRAGLQGQWTPRELRTSFVSLLSETGMAIEEISHLVGHSSTVVTETVYRHELRPVIRSGADAMDQLFPGSSPKVGSGSSGPALL